MPKLIDLSEKRFGKLVAKFHYAESGQAKWHCECDCGGEKEVLSGFLRKDVGPRCCDDCKEPVASPSLIDISNHQFGLLVVKSYQGDGKWLCLCKCNHTTIVESKHLRNGNTVSCGEKGCKQSNKPVKYNLTGQKFGYLVAKTHITKTDRWECICDCGKIVKVSSFHLGKGKQRSCGCKTKELYKETATLPNNMAAVNYIYRSYTSSAKKRNLLMDLSIEDVINLIYESCFYCGSLPTQVEITLNTGQPKVKIAYNGIDRMHNEYGYTTENSVSCCRICNRAKSDMLYEDFTIWVEQMRKYRNLIASE